MGAFLEAGKEGDAIVCRNCNPKAVRPMEREILDVEEARQAAGLKQPNKPSEREVRDHERTHLPFRDWCKHCVFGKAKNDPHRSSKEEGDGIPKISMDYMYLKEREHEGNRPAEVEGEEGMPIVVIKDSKGKG